MSTHPEWTKTSHSLSAAVGVNAFQNTGRAPQDQVATIRIDGISFANTLDGCRKIECGRLKKYWLFFSKELAVMCSYECDSKILDQKSFDVGLYLTAVGKDTLIAVLNQRLLLTRKANDYVVENADHRTKIKAAIDAIPIGISFQDKGTITYKTGDLIISFKTAKDGEHVSVIKGISSVTYDQLKTTFNEFYSKG
jgi:hypothetical protein